MALIHLTEDAFERVVDQPGIVILDFWAAWCGPCRTFGPVFEKAAERHPDITFAKVDTEAERGLAGAFQIRSIPTVMAFKDGVGVFSQPGALPAAALDELVAALRTLDVEALQKEQGGPAGA
ncbi:MAG: thioredoxin [Deltaproteobacteria bacterium]|nr:thioredoxin [Deltaproteobacteria bacterium]